MRISYRLTSSLIIVFWILSIVYTAFQGRGGPQPIGQDGTATFDLCGMWEQVSPIKQLAVLIAAPSLLAVFVQGLRNRAAPRWVILVALVGLTVSLVYDSWGIENCWTVWSFIELGAVLIMCIISARLYQAFMPGAAVRLRALPTRSPAGQIYRVVRLNRELVSREIPAAPVPRALVQCNRTAVSGPAELYESAVETPKIGLLSRFN